MSETHENARPEPNVKRVAVFMEADEFYNLIKCTFGIKYIGFSPDLLASEICKEFENFDLVKTNVYVTHQDEQTNPHWHKIWRMLTNKWRKYSKVFTHEWNVTYANVISRDSREIHSQKVFGNDYAHTQMICDVLSTMYKDEADVIILVSKDKSLSILATQVRQASYDLKRWIKVVSAFPYKKPEDGTKNSYHAGIDKTDWFHISEELYNRSIENPIGSDDSSDDSSTDE